MFKKLLLGLALTCAIPAMAAFPERPVRIVVPNQPGGPVDVLARVLADRLGAKWGQSVVVDNKPGGSGVVAGQALAKAAPDGYTLGMIVESAMTIVPFTLDSMPFDPMKDYQPIMIVARTPFLFVVRPDSPIKTWQDVVVASKKQELKMGSWSIGSAYHLIWEQTARRAGIKAQYVPSSSSTKTQTDLIGGVLDIALDAPSSARGLLDAGRLRAVAITSPTRFAMLPDTPTLNESGLPGFAPQPWIGLMAPAGVPKDLIRQIHTALVDILKEPAIVKRLEPLGMIAVGNTPEEHAQTIEEGRRVMEPLVKELGLKQQR